METTGAQEHLSTGFLEQRLAEEVDRSRRHHLPLTLIVLEIELPEARGSVPDVLRNAMVLLARAVVGDGDLVAPFGPGRLAVATHASAQRAAELADALASELQAFDFTCGGRAFELAVRSGLACLGERMRPRDLMGAAANALATTPPSASPPGLG